MPRTGTKLALTLALLAAAVPAARAAGTRIKDITEFEGARPNQLTGIGLVVGLENTGGRSLFTQQVAVDMLQKLNVSAKIFNQSPSDNVIRSTNVSAVMVGPPPGYATGILYPPLAIRASRRPGTCSRPSRQ